MALKHKTHNSTSVAVVQRQSMQTVLTEHEPEQRQHPANVLQRNPAALRPADILALQRTVGNRVVQRMLHRTEEDKPIKGHSLSRRETGLPDNLKSGVESLSGISMDDVRVHYNSAKPAELQAHAFTQGTDIYLGPNEEEHLPHEAWHVVQQRQGRVRPTTLLAKGLAANDDASLEREADEMGAWSLRQQPSSEIAPQISPAAHMGSTGVVQRTKWKLLAGGEWEQQGGGAATDPPADLAKHWQMAHARPGEIYDDLNQILRTGEGGPRVGFRFDAGAGGGGGGGGWIRDDAATASAAAKLAAVAKPKAEGAKAPKTATRPPLPPKLTTFPKGLLSYLYVKNGVWRQRDKGTPGHDHAEKGLWDKLKKNWPKGRGQKWVGFVQNGAPCSVCFEFFKNESADAEVKKKAAGFAFQISDDQGNYRAEEQYNTIGDRIRPNIKKSFGIYFIDGKVTFEAPEPEAPKPKAKSEAPMSEARTE